MAIRFSDEQNNCLKLFEVGHNLCLTGAGGCGKSLLIREMVKKAKRRNKTVSVTALTGCAAYLLVDVECRTIHSWSGLHRFNAKEVTGDTIRYYVKLLHKKRKASMTRWLNTDILIIDEISMMSSNFFTLMDGIARELRSQGWNNPELKKKPFGGIQVVVVGDFLQIPPVEKTDEMEGVHPSKSHLVPLFECKSWRNMIRRRSQVVVLKKNYRASQDEAWASMLLQLRQGRYTDTIKHALESRLVTRKDIRKEMESSLIKPTVLVSTRLKADAINIANLAKCAEDTETKWNATAVRRDMESKTDNEVDLSSMSSRELDAWTSAVEESIVPKTVVLRKGAQVMCLYNVSTTSGLVNGSRGIVTGYESKHGYPIVKWKTTGAEIVMEPVLMPTRHPLIFVKQIPLCQAWAITIHKSQGQTLDYAEVDIGRSVFVPGQAYVALSRVRSLNSLYISDLSLSSIRAEPYALRFCAAIGDR